MNLEIFCEKFQHMCGHFPAGGSICPLEFTGCWEDCWSWILSNPKDAQKIVGDYCRKHPLEKEANHE